MKGRSKKFSGMFHVVSDLQLLNGSFVIHYLETQPQLIIIFPLQIYPHHHISWDTFRTPAARQWFSKVDQRTSSHCKDIASRCSRLLRTPKMVISVCNVRALLGEFCTVEASGFIWCARSKNVSVRKLQEEWLRFFISNTPWLCWCFLLWWWPIKLLREL